MHFSLPCNHFEIYKIQNMFYYTGVNFLQIFSFVVMYNYTKIDYISDFNP